MILNSGFAAAGDVAEHLCGWLPPAVRPLVAAVAAPLASLDAGCGIPGTRPEEHVPLAAGACAGGACPGGPAGPGYRTRLGCSTGPPSRGRYGSPIPATFACPIEHPAGYLEEVARLLSHRLPPTPLTARSDLRRARAGSVSRHSAMSRRRTPSTSAPEVATRR